MTISKIEAVKMKRAKYIGDKMVGYLEKIGIEKLSDLKDCDAMEIALEVDDFLGKTHLSGHSLAIEALENVILLANNHE